MELENELRNEAKDGTICIGSFYCSIQSEGANELVRCQGVEKCPLTFDNVIESWNKRKHQTENDVCNIKLYYKILSSVTLIGKISVIGVYKLFHHLSRDPKVFVEDEYNHNFDLSKNRIALDELKITLTKDDEQYIFEFPDRDTYFKVLEQTVKR